MGEFKEEPKMGPPAYMVSFGDMMTLILTFFILLVSLSSERKTGLMAKGVGSFVVALKSHGMDGILSSQEKMAIFNDVRRRFSLPEEQDPDRRVDHLDASQMELLRTKGKEALEPQFETFQPQVALFPAGQSELDAASRAYLDLLAESLRPKPGQLLLLEGHALDESSQVDDSWLAYQRAAAVKRYLVKEQNFQETRVEARAWVSETDQPNVRTRSVDARLLTPRKKAE